MHVPLTEVILRHDGAELVRATLPPGEFIIGREAGVDVRADTPLLSRRHAQLTINYDHLLLEDLGSSNGTFVNDQPVTKSTRLFTNQSIRLGPDIVLEINRLTTEPGASLPPAQAAIRRHLPDELLGDKRYATGGIIARGGMGAILDAQQRATKRTVAMKVMLETGDEADVLRFIQEAQVTAQLDHPNIVPIYELGVDAHEQLFYTMKMVRGITLKKVLADLATEDVGSIKKYPLPVLLTVFQKVCDALAFAHAKGVIHRDLKPENLMLGDFGSVLVMDWGLAKILDQNSAPRRDLTRSAVLTFRDTELGTGATKTGSIMGTPAYMSPEQARGEIETLDARSDIYTLGAILFEILHLRPAVTGTDAMEIVGKVQRGEVEWNAKKSTLIPDSLLAICRQALALEKVARYLSVEDLQTDLLAYQTGFATSAEKAGAWRQITLLVKRHKAATIGIAAVLLVGAILGTKAIVEGRRAERAIVALRQQAPALRQLAESEAGFQRFDSALEKLDAALALDPAHLPSYWRRAWLFIGMDRLPEAAAALRLAQQKDPAHAELAAILPAVEELSSLSSDAPWPTESGRAVWKHLLKHGATGESVSVARKQQIGAKENQQMIRQRLDEWLGSGQGKVSIEPGGQLLVDLTVIPVATLQPLAGLKIDQLFIGTWKRESRLSALEPLREMRLTHLAIQQTSVVDLAPLRGMPLSFLDMGATKVTDISALRDAPLDIFNASNTRKIDFTVLRGNRLRIVSIGASGVSDLSFLADSPVETLIASRNHISDLRVLEGKRLKRLEIDDNEIHDLSPLRGAPITELYIYQNPLKDLTPLLDLPKLEKLRVSKLGKLLEPLRQHPLLKYIAYDDEPYRPAGEFWAVYDAQQAAGKK